MTDKKFVIKIYPDAHCVTNYGIDGAEYFKIIEHSHSLSCVMDTEENAWYEAKNVINRRMLKKLES
jgi:hypothetical protein